jgi:hypothetical protein
LPEILRYSERVAHGGCRVFPGRETLSQSLLDGARALVGDREHLPPGVREVRLDHVSVPVQFVATLYYQNVLGWSPLEAGSRSCWEA